MPNIISILKEKAQQAPNQIAYVFLEDSLKESAAVTFSELDKRAERVAAYLQHHKLNKQRLLLLFPTGVEFISVFLGCLYAEAIPVPFHCPNTNELQKSSELFHSVVNNAEISNIISLEKPCEELKKIFKKASTKITVYAREITENNYHFELQNIANENIAYLQYSSGSTSTPKAAIITHSNLLHNVLASAKAWHYTKKSITLTWAPHNHVYGLVCGLLVPMCQGTKTYILTPSSFIKNPITWLQAISQFKVTHSGGPNFAYELCINDIPNEQISLLNLESWKVAVNGGEPIRQETLTAFTEKFKKCGFKYKNFVAAYGMSELSGTISVSDYQKGPSVLNKNFMSNGKFISGINAIVVDPETKQKVSEGEIGEIWLSGKILCQGYWNSSEETQKVFNSTLKNSRKKYFKTGDMGFIKKNELFLTGRLKEVIIIFGKKYYPLDFEKTVEKALANYPVTSKRVAFSITVDKKEEIILVQEVKEPYAQKSFETIVQVIKREIGVAYKIDPYEVILVKENSIPKTPNGKLQRNLCKKEFEENKLKVVFHSRIDCQLTPSTLSRGLSAGSSELESGLWISGANPGKMMADQLMAQPNKQNKVLNEHNFIKVISAITKIEYEKIQLSDTMSKFNFDSITVTKLIDKLNKEFSLSLSPDLIFNYQTLHDFFQHLDSSVPDKLINETQLNQGHRDIAIIGMAGVFPGAPDIATFWENLILNKDVISIIPKNRWNWEELNKDSDSKNKSDIKWGGFVEDIVKFDANFFNISRREAELTDPQQRIFLQIVWKAIEDAGYNPNALSKTKTGLFVGVFNNDYAELLQKTGITDAYITTGITHSILANRVSFLLNLQGPSEAIDTACSSSLVAIHHAVKAIEDGDCEIAIAGGVNALLSPSVYIVANKAGMLSPDGRCKSFDKSANGYVRSEGVAAILLKPLDKAIEEGDSIYGIIKGTAVNHGGHVSSLTVPNPNAQAEVISQACQRAGISIDTINYIETHGTGTSLGDPIEINGLKKAFNSLNELSDVTLPFCALGAVKSQIGHLEAAAGIASLIKVLLALKHKIIPGNLHFNELNPFINLENSPFYIVGKNQPWTNLQNKAGENLPRRAGISSFGYGGTNAHLIVEEAPSFVTETATFSSYLLVISAKTENALLNKFKEFSLWLQNRNPSISLSSICYTLNVGREHFDKRCALVVDSFEELVDSINKLILGEYSENIIINNNLEIKKSYITKLINKLTQTLEEPISKDELLTLGYFYVQGYDLDWQNFYKNQKNKRVSLPTYPFDTEDYWIPEKQDPSQSQVMVSKEESQANDEFSKFQRDFLTLLSSIVKISETSIDINSSLSDLGFDSIAFNELATDLESRYQCEFNPAMFYTYNSIRELLEFIYSNFHTSITPDSKIIEPLQAAHIKPESIAIIGMSGYFPQSETLEDFWHHLESEHDLVTEITNRWDWAAYYDSQPNPQKSISKWGACIADFDKFDADFFNISHREANLMDPQQRLFLEVVWKTIEDAGYDPFSFSKEKIGIFVGGEFNEYESLITQNGRTHHGFTATGNSHSMLANRVSYFLNWTGPSEFINTACSSSLVAVHRAVTSIQNGECKIALAGGVCLMLNPDTFVFTSQLGVLSPEGRCKTFSKLANGYVKGEGVAAVLLKPLSAAIEDGDHIYGVIRGSGVNHGGKSQSLTAPNATTQAQLIVDVYSKSGIDPSHITFIETHGTGTALGDPIEVEGLKQAFKSMLKKPLAAYCALGAVKTNIGHLEPASGIAGLIKVLLSLKYQKIPGNLHLNEINPNIQLENTPFYIPKKTQDWIRRKDELGIEIPRCAGVSSFGFGGTCAHLVVEELLSKNNQPVTSKPCYLIALSAKTESGLKMKWIDLKNWLKNKESNVNLPSLSFTLNVGRTHFNYRSIFVVSSINELINAIDAKLNGEAVIHSICNQVNSDDMDIKSLNELYQNTIKELNLNLAHEIYFQKLLILGDLYTKKFPINWLDLYSKDERQRVASLPSYPFQKERFWFDLEFDMSISNTSVARASSQLIMTPSSRGLSAGYKELESDPWIPQTSRGMTESDQLTPHPSLTKDINLFILNYLKSIFSEKLAVTPDKIPKNETYEIYGVDSLLTLEIIKRLEIDFGSLPKTLLYEKNNLQLLADFFKTKYSSVIEKMLELPIASVPNTDIAIIGVSGTFPGANNIDELWENLIEGRDSITTIPIERWNSQDYPIQVGNELKTYSFGGFIPEVDKFDPLFFGISPKEAALMDPQERLFLQSAWTTLEDAGYSRNQLQHCVNNKVGVFAGVTYNYYPLYIAEEWNKGNKLPLDIQSFSIANRISYFLNLNGPSLVIDTACSSSLSAIHIACESILQGECLMAIAGGVNLSLHPAKYHFLGSFGFMSEQGRCTSFGEGGSGYVPAEGYGSVLLKPLHLAIKDNDRIYAVIKSSSMNHGGKTSGYTVPNPNAQAELIKMALNKAKINPRTISYVEAHGTGTSLGDPIEISGLQQAFESYTDDKQFCAVGSIKSNIGHLEAAAGISQVIKVLLQMRHKKLVPSLHAEKLNPFIDFTRTAFYVQKELNDWNSNFPRRAGISSFGAGGTNAHLILEEFVAPSMDAIDTPPFLFLLSAQNEDRLTEYAHRVYVFLLENKDFSNQWLISACYTSQVGRESMSARIAILCVSCSDLLEKIRSFIESKLDGNVWSNKSTVSTHFDDIPYLLNERKLDELAKRWVDGASIQWGRLYNAPVPQKVFIPTYPFAKKICWIASSLSLSDPIKPKINDSLCIEDILDRVILVLSNTLNLNPDEIDLDCQFLNYGMDSIIGINFIGELNKIFTDAVTPMDLYRYPSANQLTNYIMEKISIKPPIDKSEIEFMDDIAHLSDEEVSKLLEKELQDLDLT